MTTAAFVGVAVLAQVAALVLLLQPGLGAGARWAALLGALALLAALAAAVLVRRSMRGLEQARQQAQKAEAGHAQAKAQLDAALDILPDALAFFDADDRLVLTNASYRAMYPMSAHRLVPGTRFEDILRESIARGEMVQAIGREEEWLRERLAQHRVTRSGLLQELADDRWIRIAERPTPDGGVIGLRTEVTEFVRAQRALEAARQEAHEARQLFERALGALPVGIEIFDQQDRLVMYNQALAEMYPYMNYPEMVGKTFEDLLRISVASQFIVAARGREEEWIAERLAARPAQHGVLLQNLAGNRWVKVYETRTPEGFMVAARMDVADLIAQQQALAEAQREAQQARAVLDDAIEALPEGFALFDANDRLVVCNTQFRKLYPLVEAMIQPGRSFEEMLRVGLQYGQYPDAIGREEAWLAQRMAQHRAANQTVLQPLPNGRWLQIEERRTPQGGIAGVRADVTELVRKEKLLAVANDQLARLSTTDELTGIANRRRFDDALATEWQRGARQKDPLSLLMIDIDHFKLYNDHYGHLAGDECLRHVSRLLGEGVRRAGELVARYGGEEFVVLLPNTDLDLAQAIAKRCMDQVRDAAIPHGRSPTADTLTLSIGMACMVPDTERQPDALVRDADAALYRAKDAGRNRIHP